MEDKLIYGKNRLSRIVNIEPRDSEVIIFQEDINGNVIESTHKHKYWILCSEKPDKSWIQLNGNLHYKFGKQFDSYIQFQRSLGYARKADYDIYTMYDAKEACLTKDGYRYFKGMKHNEVSCLSFDIESTGLYHNIDSKVLLISNTYRKNGQLIRKLFAYDEYENQADMLESWCNWVNEMNPSILLGHNIYGFDIPYLNFVAEKNGLKGLQLGRDNSFLKISSKSSQFRIDGSRSQEYNKVRCYGREIIDTMFLAIKYDVATKKYDSYGLKNIIKVEGLEKQNRVHYDSSKIRFNYKDPIEWKKIKEYCEHDADDSLSLFDLMAPSFFYMTQSIPKSFQLVIESASGSQINAMLVGSYLQDMHSIPKASEVTKYEGAISFGNAGVYRNVFKVDVASLYPSIMIESKVFDPDKDPNGHFLKLVETFTEERLKNKKLAKESKYHDDLQSSAKILINSMYGFLGTSGLQFNMVEGAAFITKTGREILQKAIDWAESKNMFVANADTDSISFNRKDQLPISLEERKELLIELNSLYPERISWEDDGYFFTVCIFKAKNYVLWDGKKLKIKGSALKASTKEPALKEFIKKVIDSIINDKSDFQDIYNSYVKEIIAIKDINRWATRKTISDKVLNNTRTNEVRIRDAIQGSELVEGDKCYVFYKNKDTLELAEKFNGEYDKDRLLGKLYDTAWIFDSVLDCELLFKNYKLKKAKQALEELIKV